MERMDKLLAGTGRWSRSEAKNLIAAGRVTAEGAVCRRPDEKYSEHAVVTVDGALVCCARLVYLMLHKPAGLVSATEDPREATVLTLLPAHLQRVGLFPAGRLDKDTEGLLLLTNDGALAHRMLSPKRHVDKRYLVVVDGMLDREDMDAFAAGMVLGDGLHCLPAGLELAGESLDTGIVTLREGKYHQIKRMLAARGKPVRYLKRITFGPLTLDPALPTGGWRPLTQEERCSLGV